VVVPSPLLKVPTRWVGEVELKRWEVDRLGRDLADPACGLTKLTLSGNQLDEAAMRKLAPAFKANKSLRSLWWVVV
jgi:hypothetical protein